MHFDIQIFFFDINDLKIILVYFSFNKSKTNICLFRLFFMSQTNSITKTSLACTHVRAVILSNTPPPPRAPHIEYSMAPHRQITDHSVSPSIFNVPWEMPFGSNVGTQVFPTNTFCFQRPKRSLKIEAEPYLYYTIIELYNMSSEVVKPWMWYYCIRLIIF